MKKSAARFFLGVGDNYYVADRMKEDAYDLWNIQTTLLLTQNYYL